MSKLLMKVVSGCIDCLARHTDENSLSEWCMLGGNDVTEEIANGTGLAPVRCPLPDAEGDTTEASLARLCERLQKELGKLKTELVTAEAEREGARNAPSICCYCEQGVFANDDEGLERLKEHVEKICPLHPMRKVEAERDRVEAAIDLFCGPCDAWEDYDSLSGSCAVCEKSILCAALRGEGSEGEK